MAMIPDFIKISYASARLSARKGRLFDSSMEKRIFSADSLTAIRGILDETEYAKIFSGKTPEYTDIEKGLNDYFIELLGKIKKFYPDDYSTLFDMIQSDVMIRDFFHDLKTGLYGAKHEKEKSEREFIKDILNNSLASSYPHIIKEYLKKDLFSPEEFIMDLMHESSLHFASLMDRNDMFYEYLKMKNTITNLRNIARGIEGQRMVSPSLIREDLTDRGPEDIIEEILKNNYKAGKDRAHKMSFSEIESCIRFFKMNFAEKSLRKDPMGKGLAIYYLIKKEDEIDKIMSAVNYVGRNIKKSVLEGAINDRGIGG